MAIDLTQDYKFVHGSVTITHTHKTESGNTTDSVPYAEKESVLLMDGGGAKYMSGTDCTWYLPGNEAASSPKPGDTITHGTDVWTILDAAREPLTNVWQCRCVLER